MYVRITNRCNLTCSHCVFSCIEYGFDMPIDIFYKACMLYKSCNFRNKFCIGGGEPCLHENLFDFVGVCYEHDIKPVIVTNGIIEDVAIALADFAIDGIINTAMLSFTEFHRNQLQSVSANVLRKYDNLNNPKFINESSYSGPVTANRLDNIIKSGRAVSIENAVNCCVGEGPMIIHNGDVKKCLCNNSEVLFNVNSYNINEVNAMTWSMCK